MLTARNDTLGTDFWFKEELRRISLAVVRSMLTRYIYALPLSMYEICSLQTLQRVPADTFKRQIRIVCAQHNKCEILWIPDPRGVICTGHHVLLPRGGARGHKSGNMSSLILLTSLPDETRD
jgi:hypothetical protein